MCIPMRCCVDTKLIRSTERLSLPSQVRFFGGTHVATDSPQSVWSNARVRDFDKDNAQQLVEKLGEYSSVLNPNYHYDDFCKLGLFRNMKIHQQQHCELHEMAQLSSENKQGNV